MYCINVTNHTCTDSQTDLNKQSMTNPRNENLNLFYIIYIYIKTEKIYWSEQSFTGLLARGPVLIVRTDDDTL